MKEYIEREAVLKILKKYSTQNGSALGRHSGAVDYAIEEVERLPTIDKKLGIPIWIPVTERMPEIQIPKWGWGQTTVIVFDGSTVRPLIYEAATIRGKLHYRWKWMWDAIHHGPDVIAWTPLPGPPK